MVALDEVYRRSERMVGRRVADEFVLVPLARRGADLDSLYNLSAVGAYIWERLDGATTGRSIVQGMVAEFDVEDATAEQDYCDFLEELVSLGAAERAP
jgi:hypothetical protein